jgi:hypothetical protein
MHSRTASEWTDHRPDSGERTDADGNGTRRAALALSPRLLPCVAGLLLIVGGRAASAGAIDEQDARDVVAVAIVDQGRAIVLATPGLPHAGRRWRFRSFDTSELPQPLLDATLSASGTKLFIRSGTDRGGVLDLTRQHRHNAALQYVAPGDLATGEGSRRHSHRLLRQRFVGVYAGTAYVMDDMGNVQAEYSALSAVRGAISEDGVVIYMRADGSLAICGETDSSGRPCRELATRVNGALSRIDARSARLPDVDAPRFLVLSGEADRAQVIDPEREAQAVPWTRRVEAALRATVALHDLAVPEETVASLVDSLIQESAGTSSAAGQPITEWQFFRVSADEALYAPVLQFAPSETVFPSAFDALPELSRRVPGRATRPSVETLYDRYLRPDREARLDRCTFYVRTISTKGSWAIEYWLYYPFDVGGLVSHPHDPEHIFVEVDKLGSAPRRVIGAGHGYLAGNNIYRADKTGAPALRLPLFAIVELGKHATAPDVDRDGQFTPGVDENEYRERAKIWGVRDVIGSINNELIAYDKTMSTARRPQDSVALASAPAVFAGEPDLFAHASCRLERLPPEGRARGRAGLRPSDWILLPPCDDLTTDCAKLHVTSHPDFLDFRTVLKEWAFPGSFFRTTYGVGPRRDMRTIGLGYAIDLARLRVPLPGRLGIDAFYWHQNLTDSDLESCLSDCKRRDGAGWGLRYEQFLSNLFGIYTATRVYTPPLRDLWVTFGPFIEVPIGRESNVSVEGGLAFRPSASPRFELRVSVGLWKPKSSYVGVRAGTDKQQ